MEGRIPAGARAILVEGLLPGDVPVGGGADGGGSSSLHFRNSVGRLNGANYGTNM